MKLLSLATFALAVAEAALSGHDLMRAPVDRRKLMEKAVPVDENLAPRLLSSSGDFQLSSSINIKFESCVNLAAEPTDDAAKILFNRDYYSYAIKGQMFAQKSFVLFNACEKGYCDYASRDYNLFMVDLQTYLSALLPYYPTRQKNYCNACAQSTYACIQQWANENADDSSSSSSGNSSGGSSSSSNSQPTYSGGYYTNNNNGGNNGNANSGGYYDESSYQQQNYYNNGYQGGQGNNGNQGGGGNYQGNENYQGNGNYQGGGGNYQGNANYQSGQVQQQYYQGQYNGGQAAQYGQGSNANTYSTYYQAAENKYQQAENAEDNEDSDDDEIDENDGGERKLEDGNGDFFYYQVVDCDKCKAMGCIDDTTTYFDNGQYYYKQYSNNGNNYQANNQDESDEPDLGAISQWALGIKDCYDTGALWQNLNLYAGFKCNDGNNGVEIALYLDDQCTLETNVDTFDNVAYQQDQEYYSESESVVNYPFQNYIDCSDKLSYAPVGYKQVKDASGYASYPCQLLFQEGSTLLLDDCYDTSYKSNQAHSESNYGEDYAWYKYDLSKSALSDNMEACSTVRSVYHHERRNGGLGWDGFSKEVVTALLVVVAAVALGAFIWMQGSCSMIEKHRTLMKDNNPEYDGRGERFIVLDDGDGKVIL